jgi:hypothetical protein
VPEIIKSETLKVDTLDLVADAMIKTYFKLFRNFGRDKKNSSQKNITIIFEQATDGMCYYASAETIRSLAILSPDSFENMLIITSSEIPETSPLHNEVSDYHSYFLIKDKGGEWYAASPANYNIKIGGKKNPSYATTIFHDQNLGNVLAKIQERDGIDFPDEDEIYEELKISRGFNKIKWGTVNIMEIKKSNGGIVTIFSNHPPL